MEVNEVRWAKFYATRTAENCYLIEGGFGG